MKLVFIMQMMKKETIKAYGSNKAKGSNTAKRITEISLLPKELKLNPIQQLH